MRDIKFRAWDDNLEVMFDWEYVMIDKDGTWIKSEPTKSSLDNNLILMQYTGLKDKNGVEIYEGDLVKFFGIDNPCVIEFQDGGFGYNCRQRYSDFTSISGHNYLYELLETIEVIGNIYKNPELLETK